MDKKQTISVVIPVYNREKTIDRCISSIINQTYKPLEIIVVDDGSSDSTVSLVEQWIDKSNEIQIKMYKQSHLGAQAARNKGIREAKGKWIAFLDSDDEWCANRLQRNIEELVKLNREDVVICSTCYLKGNGEIWKLPGKSGNVYRDLLSNPWPMFQGMLVKKSIMEEIGYLDEECPSYQEWDTAIRLAEKYEFLFINEPLFIYYINQEIDTISNNNERTLLGYKYVFYKHKQEVYKYCGRKIVKKHYGILKNFAEGKEKWFYLLKSII